MEVTSWQTRHEEINKVNITLGKENGGLKGDLALIRKEVKDLQDTNFALVREIKTRDDTKLQQTENEIMNLRESLRIF